MSSTSNRPNTHPRRRKVLRRTGPPSPHRIALLGLGLMIFGALGFALIPGMMKESATGSRWVNALYCAVITLTTIGYGDICPGENLTPVGKAFIVVLAFGGLGMFCGPIVELGGAWRTRVPGGIFVLTTITIFIGMLIFSSIEGISRLDAIYFSVITGTTIGYGDITPASNIGRLAVTMYAILVVNVVGALLEPAKLFLQDLCRAVKEVVDDDDHGKVS